MGDVSVRIARERVHGDGTAQVRASSADLGQGLTTILAQIAAERAAHERRHVELERLTEQRAGRAGGVGVAKAIQDGLVYEGLSREQARRQMFVLDAAGLVVEGVSAQGYQLAVSQFVATYAEWSLQGEIPSLLEVIEQARAPVRAGVGAGADVVYDPVGGEYSEQALRATAWYGRFLVVGFAAETNDVIENATAKRTRKGCDWIVANDVSRADSGFETDTNIVKIIYSDGKVEELALMTKYEVADLVLDRINAMCESRGEHTSGN